MNIVVTLAAICLSACVVAQGGSCRASNAGPSNANSEMKAPNKTDKLPAGVWGGQHVRAEVTESGATFEFDCAHGAITEAILLDGGGKFDIAGKFATDRAGPAVRDQESSDRRVRYSGSVKDQEMTLTITDTSSKEVIGTFVLNHGSEGRLRKCR